MFFLQGNQIRNYDVKALYSALEDVRKGISIYRWVFFYLENKIKNGIKIKFSSLN